jgi:hypothetical protein
MIPKTIHYCWLSGEAMPNSLRRCMETWKRVLPDYQIIKWDTSNFEVNSSLFVSEAIQAKKWAFASDYIRLYALYTEGGIYLDTDVFIRKKFDDFLSHKFFSAVEYHPRISEKGNLKEMINDDGTAKERNPAKPGIGLQAAILGSVRGHPYVRDCLNFYDDRHFINESGEFFDKAIAPGIFAMIAEDYGFRYKNQLQTLKEDMLILPSEVLASSEQLATRDSYAIHCCEGSWRQGSDQWQHSKLISAKLGIRRNMPKLYALIRSARKWGAPA